MADQSDWLSRQLDAAHDLVLALQFARDRPRLVAALARGEMVVVPAPKAVADD